ncbi:MAG: hypothetical protein KKH52_00805, partial [Nanoarchaeota archaeon]|nr:hypothetical protein [Nanoarchaeota archaeon]
QYYLLLHQAAVRFAPANLLLVHLPTLEVYEAIPYPGTSWYTFSVLGGKQIAVGHFGTDFLITPLSLGETPAAYVIPHNLNKEYEVIFNLESPVEIIEPDLGTLTVCQNDNPHDAEQIKICQDNNYKFTLQKGVLTEHTLSTHNLAFLYEVIENTKTVSLFSLVDLESHDDLLPYHLDYDNFTNNMVVNNRIAYKFKDNLYLMGHPYTTFLSLPQLTLTTYTTEGLTNLTASGSETQIEIPTLDGGKLFLKRNYGTPPPPFDLSALEEHELAPINLEEQLFTSFSSLGTIRIIEPSIGTVAVTESDIRQSQSVFKLSTGSGPLDLIYQEPQVVQDKALFYYHSASVETGVHVKSGSAYWYYDLDNKSRSNQHSFNDDFIDIITAGNELALKFNDTYYLLGHDNIPEEPVFFNINKLLLKTIDGLETFAPETTSPAEISFIVPGGRVFVKLDEATNKITFSSSKKKELETVTFGEKYSVVLTTAGRVKINDVYLELCNLNLYQYVAAADVCVYESEFGVIQDQQILVDKAMIKIVNGTNYLFEPNGLTGDGKQITVRKLIDFNHPDFSNWDNFIAKLVSGDVPIIKANEQLYLPVAADNLLTNFGLQAYFTGTIYSLQNIEQIGPITYNGTFALNDTVVFANQTLEGERDSRYLSTTFKVKDYSYLPDSGQELKVVSPLKFITVPGGEVYTLSNTRINGNITKSTLTDYKNKIIFDRYFAGKDTRSLYLDNILTTITIAGIGDTETNITIKK